MCTCTYECTTLQRIIIVYFTMNNAKNLERKSSEDRITCFLPLCYYPLVEPRLRIRFRRIRSLCLQIILVILVLFTGTRIPDPLFLIWSLPRLWYGSLSGSISVNHLSIFHNISCYNSLVLLTFVSRSSCRITYV
jgi:hypothetical protein